MDIRDFIVENISGQDWNPIRKSTTKSIGKSATYRGTLKDVKVTAEQRISLPAKQCNFMVTCSSMKDSSSPILLNSFNLPEAGITFDSSAENLWFPEPSINMNALTLTGYIPWTLRKSFFRLYMEQFKSGLLAMQNGRNFTLFMANRTNDYDTDIHSRSEAYAAAAAALGAITGTAAGASNIDQFLRDVKGNVDNLTAQAIKDAWSKEIRVNESSYLIGLKPIAEFVNCRVSYPTINQSQQSNDFATISIKLSYSKFKDLVKLGV